MSNYFIQDIYINKVRNHSNLHIPLSKKIKKHLIITGKNGSGKTSIMEAIRDHLSIFETHSYKAFEEWSKSINELENSKEFYIQQLTKNISKEEKETYKNNIESINKNILQTTKYLETFNEQISLTLKHNENIDTYYNNGNLILAYFSANRISNMTTPVGVEKINLRTKSKFSENIGSLFVKYLVDLKTQELFAQHEGEHDFSNKLKEWFEKIEQNLKILFENDKLSLKYDYKNYNFLIREPGKEPYSLNSLSSGFSSILNIVTELIMRMEMNRGSNYDVQGIVLIDEIEAHLHVSLQKKIFKFLTDFFPNIQFIVTTHSPFVITSIENVIIYDLETNTTLEDLSAFSYKAILEEFFKIDQYSYIAKNKIEEYKNLSEKINNLTENETKKFVELNEELSSIPDIHSQDIKLYKAQIDLKKLLSGIKND